MTSQDKNAPWGTVDTHFDPIHDAARVRNVEIITAELATGVHVDKRNGSAANGDGGNSALWFACQGPNPGAFAVVQLLVDAGANINLVCEHGTTPLHMAAKWRHHDVVSYLIKNGARVDVTNELGHRPADVARQFGRTDIAMLLETRASGQET